MAVNLLSLFDRFDSDDKCRKYLEDLRWPAETCPHAVRRHGGFRNREPGTMG